MTCSRTLELSPQKFDKLASTHFQILSYAKEASELKILFIIFNGENLNAVILSLFSMNNSKE